MMITSIILDIDFQYAISILLFNMGVTIPLVLFRASFHTTKIQLSDSIHSNYQGMITGPILFSSLLTLAIPFIVYIGTGSFMGESQPMILGAFGVLGLILRRQIINLLAKSFKKRKYHLSQCFKS